MKCTRVAAGDITIFVCGARPRRRNCQTPACPNAGVFECDAPVKRADWKSQTCDRLMCEQCRVQVPGGAGTVDYCRPHATKAEEARRAAGQQPILPGVQRKP